MGTEAFRDAVVLTVCGGNGGDGAVHFARYKYKPRGGPDGGDGGNGGDVYFKGENALECLDSLSEGKCYKAEDGDNGGPAKKTGKRGKDLFISVPIGTRIYDYSSGLLIGEVLSVDNRLIVARGGIGGTGNAKLSTARTHTPRFSKPGTKGEERTLRLVYRAYASVAIVEDLASDLSILNCFQPASGTSLYRFFEKPRVSLLTLNFHKTRTVYLPLSFKLSSFKISFIEHIYYAQNLILNALFKEGMKRIDAIWPAFIAEIQKIKHPYLKKIFVLAREDPGLPYEVSYVDREKKSLISVEVLTLPKEARSVDAFQSWIKDKLADTLFRN